MFFLGFVIIVVLAFLILWARFYYQYLFMKRRQGLCYLRTLRLGDRFTKDRGISARYYKFKSIDEIVHLGDSDKEIIRETFQIDWWSDCYFTIEDGVVIDIHMDK